MLECLLAFHKADVLELVLDEINILAHFVADLIGKFITFSTLHHGLAKLFLIPTESGYELRQLLFGVAYR